MKTSDIRIITDTTVRIARIRWGTSRFFDWRIVNLFWLPVNSEVNSNGNSEDSYRLMGGSEIRQKERALTSPKTSALAFISVLPWRINDGEILRMSLRR